MIEIQANKTIIHSQAALDVLRDEFALNHCVVLDKLLSPSLSNLIDSQLTNARYSDTDYQNSKGVSYGKEETLISEKHYLLPTLSLFLNGDVFLNAIRHITGHSEIQSFGGRIFQLRESKEGHLSWHDDLKKGENRLIGLSLNLSKNLYEGGDFSIRDKSTKKVYKQVSYRGWGSAHIFRINEGLQHMVTPVKGENSRVALGGWFYPNKVIPIR